MSFANDRTIPVYAGWIGSWQISLRRRALDVCELAERYDRAASGWSRLIERLDLPRAYERLFTQFIRKADLTPTDRPLRVLDCGVGTGALAVAFARAWAAPVRIDAVDVSGEMIDQARRRIHDAGLEASLQRADICSLPYPAGEFDLVIAAHVLEHLPDPVIALEEMHRVLKPGGWLVACLTRESILGRYIQLKWRTHRLTADLADSWLTGAGFETCRPRFAASGPLRLTSLACVGRKQTQH